MAVHTSGHGNIADIKEIIKQIRPTYFIPVYANHFFLKEAAKIAHSLGIEKDKIFVPDNGSIIEFGTKGVKVLKEKALTSYVFVDGLGVGDVGEIVIRDRKVLAKEGIFVIIAVVDRKTGQVKGSPDIISRGFIYLKISKDLLAQTRRKVISIINKTVETKKPINWANVKNEIRNKVGQFLFSKTERSPIIISVIIEVRHSTNRFNPYWKLFRSNKTMG
jgi:ribonuclease J